MKTKYPLCEDSLIAALQNDRNCIRAYGTEILAKKIPDDPRPGQMDSRSKEIMLAQIREAPAMNWGSLSIDQVRAGMGFPNHNINTVEIWTRYEEHCFDGNKVKLWMYYPRKPEGKTGRPCMIYFHGGGWVGGTVFTVENPCRLLAETADAVVVNVDYSLAPEKPFPNGFNDCFNTVKHIYENAEKYGIDRHKIGVAGDSAGGNLAAACSTKDRDLGTGMIKYQALIYPAVMLSNSAVEGFDWSIEDYEIADEVRDLVVPGIMRLSPKSRGSGGLEALYLTDPKDADNPYVSPMLAESYKGLPKTLVATAEFDGLRVEGEVYGAKLRKAGVDTRIIRYGGVGHAFLDQLGYVPQAEDLVLEMAKDMKLL